MDGGNGGCFAAAGAPVIRGWLVIGSGRRPDGTLGAYMISTDRACGCLKDAQPAMLAVIEPHLPADAAGFAGEAFEASEISGLQRFVAAADKVEAQAPTVLNPESWRAIRTAAARRLTRLQAEHATDS